MRINATRMTTERMEVYVEPRAAVEELTRLLYEAAGLPKYTDMYVQRKATQKAQLVITQEVYTSHKWDNIKILVAEPTDAQIELVEFCNSLRKRVIASEELLLKARSK